ncbi:putative sigma-54 dependent transcriptional regulator [Aromatoleum aromaticum EbN1]|uniref:Sigma-54 dependent transcriptional regulator n=1 Tax=Aromatoleum aromaticum (strain DSM 19018 / LMG 30748 / EbN1) TaxID=76114 RepID=Q5P8R7_AROAE|nr:sigma-54-dependent Fis family transcriptional regulator [Aromatoleum aromaticum]CAI06292.1 putative sigma-54 dependent transcriptional regulator [Aromatoleum aromaticum EbN1]
MIKNKDRAATGEGGIRSSASPLGDYASLRSDAPPSLSDISACLSFSPDDGYIWLNDQRMLLLHGNVFGALRRELIDSLGVEKARGLFTRIGYIAGARDARMEQARWPDADLSALYKARLHSFEGMVKVEPVRFSFDQKSGQFDGEYLWHHSIEADEHIAAYGLGTSATCWMLTGYAMGHGSTLLGHLVIAREVSCRSMGDSVCRLIAKSAELWDDITEDMRRLNAEDFVGSPTSHTAVIAAVAGRERTDIFTQNAPYHSAMVGASAAFNAACHQLQRVAKTDATVLFTGESGVGKEMFAHMLHRIGKRAENPFIAVNCAAIPETLIESELFGVERGAYTGAVASRPGRFERADGGTLFLDEIGTLSPIAQGKLLRALQEGEIERVGGSRCIRVDVRVVAATNVDLRQAVRDGNFREDLFYRLNVYPIRLPPLRARRDDIPLLMNYFLNFYCEKYNRRVVGFTPAVIRAFLSYEFPGNIRELQNLVERGVISAEEEGTIDLPHLFTSGETLPPDVLSVAMGAGKGVLKNVQAKTDEISGASSDLLKMLLRTQEDGKTVSLEGIERALVENAVAISNGNYSAAARLLGITRSQLAYRCEKYKLAEGES